MVDEPSVESMALGWIALEQVHGRRWEALREEADAAIAAHDAAVASRALAEAAVAFEREAVALKPGGWGSTPPDVQTVEFAAATKQWLEQRAQAVTSVLDS